MSGEGHRFFRDPRAPEDVAGKDSRPSARWGDIVFTFLLEEAASCGRILGPAVQRTRLGELCRRASRRAGVFDRLPGRAGTLSLMSRTIGANLIDPPGSHALSALEWSGVRIFVDPGEVVGRALAHGLPFERFELDLFAALAQPGDVVLDVGANFGLYSIIAASRLRGDGVLHAFEPNRRVFEILERNLSAIGGTTRANAHCMAVGDQAGSVEFHCAEDSAFSSAVATGRSPVAATVSVPQVSLDGFLADRRLARVDLVKIDVEGYEPEVIRGARATLEADDAPVVVFEASPLNLGPRGLDRDEVLASIQALGFDVRGAVAGLPEAAELPADGTIENFVAFKPFRAERLRLAGLAP